MFNIFSKPERIFLLLSIDESSMKKDDTNFNAVVNILINEFPKQMKELYQTLSKGNSGEVFERKWSRMLKTQNAPLIATQTYSKPSEVSETFLSFLSDNGVEKSAVIVGENTFFGAFGYPMPMTNEIINYSISVSFIK